MGRHGGAWRLSAACLALFVALATGLVQAAFARAAELPTVPAGQTTGVPLPASTVLATCTPPGAFSQNPTVWTVNPPSVTISGGDSGMPVPGSLLNVSVPPNHPPAQPITISWTGNTDCISYNGIITLNVSAPTAPPPPPPPSAPDPKRTEMTECIPALAGTTRVRVFVQRRTGAIDDGSSFSHLCDEARNVAQGQKVPGVVCTSPAGLPRGERFVTCTSREVRIAVVPTGGGSTKPARCADVLEQGHRYLVFKLRVTCQYARSATLRMLRGIRPFVNEIVLPGDHARWSCVTWAPLPRGTLVAGAAPTQRGWCRKSGPEARWILFLPAPAK